MGVGPTAIALKQNGPWTYEGLRNHIWSFAGDDSRADISTTYPQSFVTYMTKTHTSFILNIESSCDWKNEQWSISVNDIVSQMLKIREAPLNVFVDIRCWADSPETGPDGFGFHTSITLFFI